MQYYESSTRLARSAFWGALATFNRRRELTRLSHWASVKGYQQPLRLYRWQLQDEEMRIGRHSLQHRHAVRFAYLVHIFNTIFFSSPRYFRKGIARHYSRSPLTAIRKGL